MISVSRARRSFFCWTTAIFSLYQIFVKAAPEKRTLPYVALSIAAAVVASWIVSYFFGIAVKRQIERNNRLQPDLQEEETVVAGSAANYRLYGGKLVVTNRRLCYLGAWWGVPKEVVVRPIGQIAAFRPGKGNRLQVQTTDGATLTFRLADSPQRFARLTGTILPTVSGKA